MKYLLQIQFNGSLFEVLMQNKTICRITKYLTDDSFSRLVRFDELHPKLQDEIIDAINEYHAQEI